MRIILFLSFILFYNNIFAQDSVCIHIEDQYERNVNNAKINCGNIFSTSDIEGNFFIDVNCNETINIVKPGFDTTHLAMKSIVKSRVVTLNKKFSWIDLLTPMFYIKYGGIWFLLLIIFAETGLFIGFFLPGDSLLFVAGIYSKLLISDYLGMQTNAPLLDLLMLGASISFVGIIGNSVGYWFGRKSGPFLFERKDTFFYKKKYLFQAKDFYDKHGAGTIIMARFIPFVRTFAPIVAGIVQMDKKKFSFYNIVGSIAWVFSMLFAGHYLQQLIYNSFGFDLKKHLEVIVIGIVIITTAPVIIKMLTKKKVKHFN